MGTILVIMSTFAMLISLHKGIDLMELVTSFCIMLIGQHIRGLEEKRKKLNHESDKND